MQEQFPYCVLGAIAVSKYANSSSHGRPPWKRWARGRRRQNPQPKTATLPNEMRNLPDRVSAEVTEVRRNAAQAAGAQVCRTAGSKSQCMNGSVRSECEQVSRKCFASEAEGVGEALLTAAPIVLTIRGNQYPASGRKPGGSHGTQPARASL